MTAEISIIISVITNVVTVLIPLFLYASKLNREIGELKTEINNLKEKRK